MKMKQMYFPYHKSKESIGIALISYLIYIIFSFNHRFDGLCCGTPK